MRTTEEIRVVLETAKLDGKDLLPMCQEVVFDEHFSGTDLRLLELDDEVLQCIKVGNTLVLRGDGNDSSVLCTDSATFDVKEAETSNSLLILENVLYPDKIETPSLSSKSKADTESNTRPETTEASFEVIMLDADETEEPCETKKILNVVHSYYELRKVKPSLGRIYSILEPMSYRGPQFEKELWSGCDASEPTLDLLLDKVPGSRGEIEEHLTKKLKTIVLDGKLRLVQSEYLFQVLSHTLDCIDSNSWDRTSLARKDVVNDMAILHPRFIIQKLFDWFFVQNSGEVDDNDMFAMNEFEICRFLGEVILKSNKRFGLTDFMKTWQESVPEGFVVELKQLTGYAVCDVECEPAVIWYLPEDSLPDTIQERFAVLFEVKPKWTQDEILPFINSLAVTSHGVGILLTKYARVHTINNRKYYCAKHSK